MKVDEIHNGPFESLSCEPHNRVPIPNGTEDPGSSMRHVKCVSWSEFCFTSIIAT